MTSVATTSEARLWRDLQRRWPGWVREYSTGRYRVDFYCPAARLAVEVDGSSHAGAENARSDFERDKWHQDQGITTLRVSVGDVLRHRRWVLRKIDQAVEQAGCESDRRTRRQHRREVKAGAVYTGPAVDQVLDAGERPLEVRDPRLAEGLKRYGSIPRRDDLIPHQRRKPWARTSR